MSGASIAPALLLLPGIDGTGKFLREFANALRPSVEPIIVPYPLDRALGYDELEALVLALERMLAPAEENRRCRRVAATV